MRKHYNEQLTFLNGELIEMGRLCGEVIHLAACALASGNLEVADSIAPMDQTIDQKQRAIEQLCLELLLRQQPVAGDLRLISAAMKMITDMERIGDQAEDIAEIIPFLVDCSLEDKMTIHSMSQTAAAMVADSIAAYVKRDVTLARTVIEEDDVVDDAFLQVKKNLIALIARDPEQGEHALDLLMIAKYFERIADHATNIAEAVVSLAGDGFFAPES